jgi:hypothetical protein
MIHKETTETSCCKSRTGDVNVTTHPNWVEGASLPSCLYSKHQTNIHHKQRQQPFFSSQPKKNKSAYMAMVQPDKITAPWPQLTPNAKGLKGNYSLWFN